MINKSLLKHNFSIQLPFVQIFALLALMIYAYDTS